MFGSSTSPPLSTRRHRNKLEQACASSNDISGSFSPSAKRAPHLLVRCPSATANPPLKRSGPSTDLLHPNPISSPSFSPLETRQPLRAAQSAPIDGSWLWSGEVVRLQQSLKFDLLGPEAARFASMEDLMAYITQRQRDEAASEKSNWEEFHRRMDPLARILEKLCGFAGDAVSVTFPPNKVIFAVLGQIASAYIGTREDFVQIGDALGEMHLYLQVIESVVDLHPKHALRDACVHLLAQVLTVLRVIVEMKRDGYLRRWLISIFKPTRPLTQALQNLHQLASRQKYAMIGVTLEKVSQLMSNVVADRVTQSWVQNCLIDVMQAVQSTQDDGFLTRAEVIANRNIILRIEPLLQRHTVELRAAIASFGPDKNTHRLRKLQDDYAQGTGSWFLDSSAFHDLQEERAKSVLLSGKAGSGKSILIAAAIRLLEGDNVSLALESMENPKISTDISSRRPVSLVLSYIFDTTAGSGEGELHSLLLALLQQLALKLPERAPEIFQACEKAVQREALIRLLTRLLRVASPCIFIVIDALSEAIDEDAILALLKSLKEIPSVRLLASRRPPVHPDGIFDIVVSIDDSDTNRDIGTWLKGELSPVGSLRSIRDRDMVLGKLLPRAGGNFRYTKIVVQELRGIAGIPGRVRERLHALPGTLEALYKQYLDDVDPADRDIVRHLLLWLALSAVPLSQDDFTELMCFEDIHTSPVYDPDLRPLFDFVVKMVGSTLIYDDLGTVKFTHASVPAFVVGLPASVVFPSLPAFYILMARTCLAYLAACAKPSPPAHDSHLTWTWVHYVDKAGIDRYSDIAEELSVVISSVGANADARALLNRALWTATRIGHHRIVALLIEHGADIESANSKGQTALHLAVISCRLVIANLLFKHGAVIDALDNMDHTPLHVAARKGHIDVIHGLVDAGAALEVRDANGWTPLHFAVYHSEEQAVSVLLGRGSDPWSRADDGTTLMNAIGGSSSLSEDTQRDERIRELLVEASREK